MKIKLDLFFERITASKVFTRLGFAEIKYLKNCRVDFIYKIFSVFQNEIFLLILAAVFTVQ